MKPYESFGRIKPRKLGCTVLLACLLVPLILIAVLKSNSKSFAILSFQLSIHTYLPLSTVEESNSSEQQGLETTSLPFASVMDLQRENESIKGKETVSLPLPFKEEQLKNNANAGEIATVLNAFKEEQGRNESIPDEETTALSLPAKRGDNTEAAFEIAKLPLKEKQGERELAGVDIAKLPQHIQLKEKLGENSFMTGNLIQQSKLICDYSGQRSDTCIMDGDVKVLGKSSTIILVSSSGPNTPPESTWKIRPYARKWEAPVMAGITEITLKSSADTKKTPHCAVNHSIPAVVFSTGGFLGNLFHDFNDVLIPLFVTSRQYNGEVQFLVTNFNSQWINKYQPILRHLSNYQVINMDTDERVHCFPYAHVGLKSHKVLGIDPSKTPNGYSMADFREFLRACFSLKRQVTKRINKQSRKKPRLLILLRKGSRSFTNEREVIAMARRVGYKAITAGPKETKDLHRFAQIVNSCDVMMGVHGAGLTNMVFLPRNATLIQIIPWGQLTWACRHDYGEPVPDMGIRYLEYEIGEGESSLIAQYPKDHAVFKDPLSIHKQGFNAIWSVFLNKQKVKLDVNRFRGVLLEVFQSLKL
ncbi:beta-1,2-xylosyltransferase XYXT1 isoform X2 [Elaeis guineensis]|uniref:Alpha-1,3-arabinosyltransferase XAT3 isoform X2 n=1 Tax=Elaeis guineensis var. tenera TaxID=51953 RepID=A0A6I9R185_ELAGV|nr:alpha-1,3-arabinosyltransferase XAT3 isoform X2 [Elaeis guineensis]